MISFRNCLLAIAILAGTIYSGKLFANNHVSKPWKLTEQQFLDQYGKDDSSRALIRFYFERRKTSRKASFWFSGGAAVFGLTTQAVVTGNNGGRGDDNLGGGLLFLFAGLFLFAIVAVVAIVKWISRTKKYLFKLVNRYNGNKGVPKRIATHELFQKFLKEEHVK